MKKILITLFTVLSLASCTSTKDFTDINGQGQEALAKKYVQALRNKDLNTVNQLIDYDTFADRMISHLSVKDKLPRNLKVSFINAQKPNQKIYSNNAYITLLGWRELPNFSGYLIRLFSKKHSPSYLALVTQKINQQWKIVDFYEVVGKKTTSSAVATQLSGVSGIIKQLKNNYGEADRKKLARFLQYKANKQFPQAIKSYRSFPSSLKKEEFIVDLGLDIRIDYPDSKRFYNELLTVIAQYHQNNPKYYGLLSNYFLMKQNYDKAREIEKNFFSSLSDNTMLYFSLADISLAEKDFPRALKEIKQCTKVEPNFKPCYLLWLGTANKMKNYDEKVAFYNALSKNFGKKLTKSMFNENKDGDFIHSDAFKNWDIPEK